MYDLLTEIVFYVLSTLVIAIRGLPIILSERSKTQKRKLQREKRNLKK